MSVTGDFYQYRDDSLRLVDVTLSESLTVADSFLVQDGKVRALDRHFARFAAAIDDQATISELEGFFTAVREVLPKRGDWFPRLEYRDQLPNSERLVLRLREAPERSSSLSLWTFDEPDPRRFPRVKGPDLSICQQLRRAANVRGADEAVLLSPEGYVADGALSAIVWWRENVLCAPSDETAWLPSITRELVFELANQAGFETRCELAKPADLAGLEVWSLSSLQGIRYATSWSGMKLGKPRFAQTFSKRLAMLAS